MIKNHFTLFYTYKKINWLNYYRCVDYYYKICYTLITKKKKGGNEFEKEKIKIEFER